MQAYSLISYIISYGFLMAYFLLFIGLKYTKKKSLAICAISASGSCVMECLLLYVFSGSSFFYVTATLIQIFVTQFTAVFISKTRDSKAVFTGLSGSNYVMAGGIVGAVVEIYSGSGILAILANGMTHFLLLLILVIKIRKIYLSFFEKRDMGKWWGLCLIPSLFYSCFCFLAMFPNSLHDDHQNILGVILLLITMFVSYIVIFRYVENETKRSELYWENELFESYIHGLESQYKAVEKAEYNLRILRHDMRHYIGIINTLLEQKEYDEVKKIIGNVSEVISDNKIRKYCENIKVNSIVSNLMEKADGLGASVNVKMTVPERVPVDDLELASVVANLLENALDSVEELKKEERSVSLLVRCADSRLIIEAENRCGKEVQMNPITKLPVSQKGKGHGIGLQSVSAFANKLDADFDCYCEDGTFTVRLLANF